jgi:hypothetical protein
MSEPHPAREFVQPLLDLAEGRTEPGDWVAWWAAHAARLEAACPRGWFLRIKPQADAGENQAVAGGQVGACYILDHLQVPYVKSDRYLLIWQEEFRQSLERRKAEAQQQAQQFKPRIDALAKHFPKLGRFLKKEIDAIDQLDEPASDAELGVAEQSLGAPLPAMVRQFLSCTKGLALDGLAIGLTQCFRHPAAVAVQGEDRPAVCLADYWLEADGDQVLIEAVQTPSDDPPVYYYAHAAGNQAARQLAPSFSAWLESLPKSPVLRR